MTPDRDRNPFGASLGDGIPDFAAARHHLRSELLRFARRLRAAGVSVPPTGPLDAAQALAVVGLGDREQVEAALRSTFITDSADLDAFESGFESFWQRLRGGLDGIATDHEGRQSRDGVPESPSEEDPSDEADPETLPDARVPDLEPGEDDPGGDIRIPLDGGHATAEAPASAGDRAARRYSATGDSTPVDVEHTSLSTTDLQSIDRFVDAIATLPGRRRRAVREGDRVDARRALRASLTTGGAPIVLPGKEPIDSELRCCVCLDVSGSVLDTIDRPALLAVAAQLCECSRASRVFMFDTELIDVTDQFSDPAGEPAAALRQTAVKWGGGTQIGHAFETIREQYPDAVDRRTVCLVVSDGLDVGDPDRLRSSITWLANRAAAVLWLNPLAVSPAYEPTSRGMSTCLPYLDGLFGFAGASDLAAVATHLERHGATGYRPIDGPLGQEGDV